MSERVNEDVAVYGQAWAEAFASALSQAYTIDSRQLTIDKFLAEAPWQARLEAAGAEAKKWKDKVWGMEAAMLDAEEQRDEARADAERLAEALADFFKEYDHEQGSYAPTDDTEEKMRAALAAHEEVKRADG